jgi:Uma2 family endonuclease
MMTIAEPELVLRSLDTTWTYERWEQLPDDSNRNEVIDWVLYRTTAPSFFHQWIIGQLWLFVGHPAQKQGLAYAVAAPIGVLMPGCDPVQPDFLLIRKERAAIISDRRVHGVPELIVEVPSATNQAQDTELKRRAYARAGVPEYWMLRPTTRDVLACAQPDPALGDYTQVRLVASGEELITATLPWRVQVADLFAGSPDTTL